MTQLVFMCKKGLKKAECHFNIYVRNDSLLILNYNHINIILTPFKVSYLS